MATRKREKDRAKARAEKERRAASDELVRQSKAYRHRCHLMLNRWLCGHSLEGAK